MAEVPVGPGTRVTLKFSLSLATGETIDQAESATFEVGDGSLLPGFESAIFGMKAGESASLEIEARHGFGEPNEDNVHRMKRINFNDMNLDEGLVVSFKDGEGNELPGVVKKVDWFNFWAVPCVCSMYSAWVLDRLTASPKSK